jgi:RHS repeat-associated protein
MIICSFEYADARMPVAVTKAGTKYYLAYDQAGTLKAVADASGTVLLRRQYDSFGNILSEEKSLPFAVPFGFAGGLYDRDTGLVRFGYRDYDPETGRWTAKDPILFAGGDTDLYGYCLNDPVNFIDPVGWLTIYGAVGSSVYAGARLFTSCPVSGTMVLEVI